MKEGRYEEACAKFEDSRRLSPALGTLLNLGLCEEARGRLATAAARFREFIQVAEPHDKRVEIAHVRLSALTPRIPRLILHSQQSAHGHEEQLWLDSSLLSFSVVGNSLQIDPGHHVVRLSIGPWERRVSFTAHEGELIERWIDSDSAPLLASALPTPPAAPPPLPVSSSVPALSTPSSRISLPGILIGAGSLALLTSLTAGIVSIHEIQVTRQRCNADKVCDDVGYAATLRGRRAVLIGDIALVTGLVGVGAGFGLLLYGQPSSSSSSAFVGVKGTW